MGVQYSCSQKVLLFTCRSLLYSYICSGILYIITKHGSAKSVELFHLPHYFSYSCMPIVTLCTNDVTEVCSLVLISSIILKH